MLNSEIYKVGVDFEVQILNRNFSLGTLHSRSQQSNRNGGGRNTISFTSMFQRVFQMTHAFPSNLTKK